MPKVDVVLFDPAETMQFLMVTLFAPRLVPKLATQIAAVFAAVLVF
jgi:hypothetical protein